MRAVMVSRFGGPEVLEIVDVDAPTPGPGQLLVETSVSGVNFFDVYQRTGKTPLRPGFAAGVEGVGVVRAVGAEVDGVVVGQRVGWLSGGQGAFADLAIVDAAKAVPIPDGIDDDAAVAVLMQGITAHYLACDTYPIQPGDTVLVHAAAGGVGLLLTQIAALRGATVIGTVSSEAKAAAAREAGAAHVLGYHEVPTRVRELTGDRGVAAVYDGVGAATFDGSLASLRPRGVLVCFGAASGPQPLLDISRLMTGGSLYVTRPSVAHYATTAEELRGRVDEVFGWVGSGQLRAKIGGRFPIADVADAFTELESRRTTGKLLLIH